MRLRSALCLVLASTTVVVAPAAPAVGQAEVGRLAGADRYETAAAVARETFEPGVAVAYVATGEDFADALAGGAAAGAGGGPILLTRADSVPQPTVDELRRLRPERIALLGGELAITQEVAEALLPLAGDGGVDRLAGGDRFATAAAVAADGFDPGVEAVYVTTGLGFADALTVGAVAAERGAPVLLVNPANVPDPTREQLTRLQPAEVIVVGGEQAVPERLLPDLAAAAGAPVRRVGGVDRYATAAALTADAFPSGAPAVLLASGAAYPDALAAAPAAAAAGGVVLLAEPVCVPRPVRAELGRLAPQRVTLLGGTAALATTVERLAGCEAETTVLASGLQVPWEVVFVGDLAYLTERPTGRLLVREPDGTVSEVQRFAVDPDGEGGLLGLAASPDFAADGLLYAYLTTPEDNRIVRFRVGEQPQPILVGIPSGSIHNGGRLAFGPDGKLYATAGDAAQGARSQDPGSLGGKILRLEPDGSIPADNPIPGSPVYALGFRNPQGLAWDRQGRLYASELGPDRDDEVNLVVPGGNYGWPDVTGTAGRQGLLDPIAVRQPPEASWSGAAVLVDGAIGPWEGDLFVAALRGRRLWRFDLDGDGRLVDAEVLLDGEHGRLRAVRQAPDGSLWILTSNGTDDRVIRLGPSP